MGSAVNSMEVINLYLRNSSLSSGKNDKAGRPKYLMSKLALVQPIQLQTSFALSINHIIEGNRSVKVKVYLFFPTTYTVTCL